MSDLVSVADQKTFMGVSSSTDDTLIGDLLTHVEDALERACGRSERPFVAAASGRTEVQDGTCDGVLFLDYPISTITTIKLGYDPSSPDETITASDLTAVTWVAGSRRIARVDGGTFGNAATSPSSTSSSALVRPPRYVQVVYDTQADLPDVAKLALKRAVANIYRQRGSEDASSETLNGFSHTLSDFATDPIWLLAVKECGEPRI